jgi:hypothetical protein
MKERQEISYESEDRAQRKEKRERKEIRKDHR